MVRHRIFRPLVVIALLTGCATSTEIRGPGGEISHLVDCSGAAIPLASTEVVEIRAGRRRAAATATSLAEARRRVAGEAVIGFGG
jgi:hypothetical protein